MLSLKIECPCGQHYAFEVEPVVGRMPAPVACPVCGGDGTAIANELILQTSRPSPQNAPSSPLSSTDGEGRGKEEVSSPHNPTTIARRPAAPSRHAVPLAAQPNKTQALFEARAKISWGDQPREVIKYLMIQGYPYAEAAQAVEEMFAERAAAIRQRGFVYIAGGAGLICVPILTWIGFLHAGVIYPRFLIVTIFVGLGGIGLLIKGIFMFVTPKSTSGDVAEQ